MNGASEPGKGRKIAMPVERVALSAEVKQALAGGRPVVALESTILCHGLPFPSNLETHRAAEEAVRQEGAVPALVAVVEGRARAGFSGTEAESLARAGRSVTKATTRDLGLLAARRQSGATTVAATMSIAAAAGIRVFATGGIGGVHRGARDTFDVSADLLELSRTRVVVVASGAKAVLDLPKTLEALETLGVPVYGFRYGGLSGVLGPWFGAPSRGLLRGRRRRRPGRSRALGLALGGRRPRREPGPGGGGAREGGRRRGDRSEPPGGAGGRNRREGGDSLSPRAPRRGDGWEDSRGEPGARRLERRRGGTDFSGRPGGRGGVPPSPRRDPSPDSTRVGSRPGRKSPGQASW